MIFLAVASTKSGSREVMADYPDSAAARAAQVTSNTFSGDESVDSQFQSGQGLEFAPTSSYGLLRSFFRTGRLFCKSNQAGPLGS